MGSDGAHPANAGSEDRLQLGRVAADEPRAGASAATYPGCPASTTTPPRRNYVNAGTNIRRPGNRLGASYTFNYDLLRDTFIQQRYTTYYNSQCCGVAIEYQTFNYGGSLAAYGLTQDKRFNLSFTLAGIGTFSNLFGAFGGQQGRR